MTFHVVNEIEDPQMTNQSKHIEIFKRPRRFRIKNRFIGAAMLVAMALTCLIAPKAVEKALNDELER